MAAAPPPPLVTIIIVAYRSNATLPGVMAALAAQTERRFALTVVDNAAGGPDAVDPALLAPGARLIAAPDNPGFAAGNNLAAEGLGTPFLAFLNPDAFPEAGWLAALLAAADRRPEAAAFGSIQIRADDPRRYDGLGDVMHVAGFPYRGGFGWPRGEAPREDAETFSACAAAMLVRTAAFRAVGGFDERFFCFCEDVDLGFRLRLAGWSAVQVAGAVARHVGGGSAGERSAFADFHGARNRLWTYVKNMPLPLLLLGLPGHLALTLALLALHGAQGRGAATARGLAAGLAGLGDFIRDRRRLLSGRVASDLEIARALAWSPWALARRSPVLRRLRSAGTARTRAPRTMGTPPPG